MGAKMRKGFKSFCNNDTSTSTLNYQTPAASARPVSSSPYTMDTSTDLRLINERESQTTTLEEMLLQLDMEEKMAKLNEYGPPHHVRHRMSCVSSSDILRTTKERVKSVSPILLMAKMPCIGLLSGHVSFTKHKSCVCQKIKSITRIIIRSAVIKRQSLRQKRRYEMENKRSRGRVVIGTGCNSGEMNQKSCSRNGHCVMKPVEMQDLQEVGWPMRGGVCTENNDDM
ncbi:hypothetical protein HAX54_015018 [Datura stramonium]|uniref:Uncharacterized protein n=1 Tax=Datura stramonium TaxID=4076 RepID=A0ABS8RZ38_DATST|nr:hypothetical protein [Datura stramonium]